MSVNMLFISTIIRSWQLLRPHNSFLNTFKEISFLSLQWLPGSRCVLLFDDSCVVRVAQNILEEKPQCK